jgi:preprotein translocase subunit SecB
MANENTPEPNAAGQAGEERQFALRTVYLKDMSFESPNAPTIFQSQGEWKPETSLHLDIKVNNLDEQTHEVVLTVTVTTKAGEKTAYVVEVQQAGVVSAHGFSKEEYGPLFYVYCASILFPYARQAVSDLVAKGGFPQLVLQHINFDAIYAQKLAEKQPGTDGAAAPTTH